MTIAIMRRSLTNRVYNLHQTRMSHHHHRQHRLVQPTTATTTTTTTTPLSTTTTPPPAPNPNQYQYPLHTETPTITQTLASPTPHNPQTPPTTTTLLSPPSPSPPSRRSPPPSHPPPNQPDRFDDADTLTPSQRSSLLKERSSRLLEGNLTSSPMHGPILPSPPGYLPPNLPSSEMGVPTTRVSTLGNGIRVASQETYGQVSTFGLVVDCGSRLETEGVSAGANHLLELLAFGGSEARPEDESISATLDSIGGTSFCNSSREQFLYCIDVLRPNVGEAMDVLADVVLYPRIREEELEQAKRVVEYQWMDMVPEVRVGEGLQMAAYGPLGGGGGAGGGGEVQQLGRPHFCTLDALPEITLENLLRFRADHLLNPEKMVVAGAGIDHDLLVKLADSKFGHLAAPPSPSFSTEVIPSVYTGGDYRQSIPQNQHPLPPGDSLTRIALALPTEGWTSTRDVLSTCILQTLLGGGNSFSAGGPGKGMYSRLYRRVLNRYHWVESCEAFTSFHNEAGLVGMGGSTTPERSADLVRVVCDHWRALAEDLVGEEEFDRARNMLKCNVLTQLESRLVLFEDVGRQILTYGRREGTEEMCEKIDGVGREDLRDLVRRAMGAEGGEGGRNRPTLCVVGERVDYVPSLEEVEGWLRS